MSTNIERNPTGSSHRSDKIPLRLFRMRPLSIMIVCALAAPAALAENLHDFFQLAVKKDPEIRQARANFDARHASLDIGRAALFPTITASAAGSRDAQAPASNYSFANGYYTSNYRINLQQAVVNFQYWYAYQSARKNDESAALTLAQSEQQLIMKVANAYFNILKSEANLESYSAEEAAARQVLESTKEKFDVGLVTITDVHDSQANADLTTVAKLLEENNLNKLREALAAITGQEFGELAPLNSAFPIASADPASIDTWVKLAQDNNIAIKIAQRDVDAKQLDAKATKAAGYPTVAFSTSYTWSKSGLNASFYPSVANEGSSIGLNFSIPLYTGGSRSAQIRQAYSTRDAFEEALLKSQRDNAMVARNAYRSLETDVKAVAARTQALLSAQTAYESTQVGAEVGTRNIVEVVQAQKVLFQNQRDLATARFTYVIDTLLLKQAAGVLNPQDVEELNQWLHQ
ncbi:MAG: TolC family outer membrane protein [Gammaproteobacteria bacterium]